MNLCETGGEGSLASGLHILVVCKGLFGRA